jgi:predicted aspartyl protease
MPSLSRGFEIRVGPLVQISIGSPGTEPAAFPHQLQTVWALIDTGAQQTCISPSVAVAAQIEPIGMQPMRSATHVVNTNVYLVDLRIRLDSFVLYPGVQIGEFPQQPKGSRFDAILGRDVLCKGRFIMEKDRYTLCLEVE